MRRAAAGEKVREPEEAQQTTESGKVGETEDGEGGGGVAPKGGWRGSQGLERQLGGIFKRCLKSGSTRVLLTGCF